MESLSPSALIGRQAVCYSDSETFQFSSHKVMVKDLNDQYLRFIKASYAEKSFVNASQILQVMSDIVT